MLRWQFSLSSLLTVYSVNSIVGQTLKHSWKSDDCTRDFESSLMTETLMACIDIIVIVMKVVYWFKR